MGLSASGEEREIFYVQKRLNECSELMVRGANAETRSLEWGLTMIVSEDCRNYY